jgi:hypothetical protein
MSADPAAWLPLVFTLAGAAGLVAYALRRRSRDSGRRSVEIVFASGALVSLAQLTRRAEALEDVLSAVVVAAVLVMIILSQLLPAPAARSGEPRS